MLSGAAGVAWRNVIIVLTPPAAEGEGLLIWYLSAESERPQWVRLLCDGPPPCARVGHAVCCAADLLLLHGGAAPGGGGLLSDTHAVALLPNGRRWRRVASRGAAPARRRHSLTNAPGRGALILYGGESPGGGGALTVSGEVWQLDHANQEWTLLAADGPRRHSHTAAVVPASGRGEWLLAYGGWGDGCQGAVLRFCLETLRWLPSVAEPSGGAAPLAGLMLCSTAPPTLCALLACPGGSHAAVCCTASDPRPRWRPLAPRSTTPAAGEREAPIAPVGGGLLVEDRRRGRLWALSCGGGEALCWDAAAGVPRWRRSPVRTEVAVLPNGPAPRPPECAVPRLAAPPRCDSAGEPVPQLPPAGPAPDVDTPRWPSVQPEPDVDTPRALGLIPHPPPAGECLPAPAPGAAAVLAIPPPPQRPCGVPRLARWVRCAKPRKQRRGLFAPLPAPRGRAEVRRAAAAHAALSAVGELGAARSGAPDGAEAAQQTAALLGALRRTRGGRCDISGLLQGEREVAAACAVIGQRGAGITHVISTGCAELTELAGAVILRTVAGADWLLSWDFGDTPFTDPGQRQQIEAITEANLRAEETGRRGRQRRAAARVRESELRGERAQRELLWDMSSALGTVYYGRLRAGLLTEEEADRAAARAVWSTGWGMMYTAEVAHRKALTEYEAVRKHQAGERLTFSQLEERHAGRVREDEQICRRVIRRQHLAERSTLEQVARDRYRRQKLERDTLQVRERDQRQTIRYDYEGEMRTVRTELEELGALVAELQKRRLREQEEEKRLRELAQRRQELQEERERQHQQWQEQNRRQQREQVLTDEEMRRENLLAKQEEYRVRLCKEEYAVLLAEAQERERRGNAYRERARLETTPPVVSFGCGEARSFSMQPPQPCPFLRPFRLQVRPLVPQHMLKGQRYDFDVETVQEWVARKGRCVGGRLTFQLDPASEQYRGGGVDFCVAPPPRGCHAEGEPAVQLAGDRLIHEGRPAGTVSKRLRPRDLWKQDDAALGEEMPDYIRSSRDVAGLLITLAGPTEPALLQAIIHCVALKVSTNASISELQVVLGAALAFACAGEGAAATPAEETKREPRSHGTRRYTGSSLLAECEEECTVHIAPSPISVGERGIKFQYVEGEGDVRLLRSLSLHIPSPDIPGGFSLQGSTLRLVLEHGRPCDCIRFKGSPAETVRGRPDKKKKFTVWIAADGVLWSSEPDGAQGSPSGVSPRIPGEVPSGGGHLGAGPPPSAADAKEPRRRSMAVSPAPAEGRSPGSRRQSAAAGPPPSGVRPLAAGQQQQQSGGISSPGAPRRAGVLVRAGCLQVEGINRCPTAVSPDAGGPGLDRGSGFFGPIVSPSQDSICADDTDPAQSAELSLENATPSDLRRFLDRLYFTNQSANPGEGTRTVWVVLTEPSGLESRLGIAVELSVVDDPTIIDFGFAATAWRLNCGAVPPALRRYTEPQPDLHFGSLGGIADVDTTHFGKGWMEASISSGFQEGDSIVLQQPPDVMHWPIFIEATTVFFRPLRRRSRMVQDEPDVMKLGDVGKLASAGPTPRAGFRVTFVSDGSASIAHADMVFKMLTFGTDARPVKEGSRTVKVTICTDDCAPVSNQLTIHVTGPLFSIPRVLPTSSYASLTYKEMAGDQRLCPFELLELRAGLDDGWDGGYVLYEVVDGHIPGEDVISIVENAMVQLGPPQDRLTGAAADSGTAIFAQSTEMFATTPIEDRLDATAGPADLEPAPLVLGRSFGRRQSRMSDAAGAECFALEEAEPGSAIARRRHEKVRGMATKMRSANLREAMRSKIVGDTDRPSQWREVRDVYICGQLMGTATQESGYLLVELHQSRALQVAAKDGHESAASRSELCQMRRKDTVALVRAVHYRNASEDPRVGRKIIRMTGCDGLEHKSMGLIDIAIQRVDDPTEIRRPSADPVPYRQASEEDLHGFTPFRDCSLYDSDSYSFNGGYLSVAFLSGCDSKDNRLGFLSVDAQEEAYARQAAMISEQGDDSPERGRDQQQGRSRTPTRMSGPPRRTSVAPPQVPSRRGSPAEEEGLSPPRDFGTASPPLARRKTAVKTTKQPVLGATGKKRCESKTPMPLRAALEGTRRMAAIRDAEKRAYVYRDEQDRLYYSCAAEGLDRYYIGTLTLDDPELDEASSNLRIDFNNYTYGVPRPESHDEALETPETVHIHMVEAALHCVTYTCIARRVRPTVTTYCIKISAGDEGGEGRANIPIDVRAPLLTATVQSSRTIWREGGNAIVVNPTIKLDSTQLKIITAGRLTCSVTGGSPGDRLYFDYRPLGYEYKEKGVDDQPELWHGRSFIGHVKSWGPHCLQLDFSPESRFTGKMLGQLLRLLMFHNVDKKPSAEQRTVKVALRASLFEEGSSVVTSIGFIVQDDMTHIDLRTPPGGGFCHIKAGCWRLAPHAEVTDADTYFFEAPISYLSVEWACTHSAHDVLTFDEDGSDGIVLGVDTAAAEGRQASFQSRGASLGALALSGRRGSAGTPSQATPVQGTPSLEALPAGRNFSSVVGVSTMVSRATSSVPSPPLQVPGSGQRRRDRSFRSRRTFRSEGREGPVFIRGKEVGVLQRTLQGFRVGLNCSIEDLQVLVRAIAYNNSTSSGERAGRRKVNITVCGGTANPTRVTVEFEVLPPLLDSVGDSGRILLQGTHAADVFAEAVLGRKDYAGATLIVEPSCFSPPSPRTRATGAPLPCDSTPVLEPQPEPETEPEYDDVLSVMSPLTSRSSSPCSTPTTAARTSIGAMTATGVRQLTESLVVPKVSTRKLSTTPVRFGSAGSLALSLLATLSPEAGTEAERAPPLPAMLVRLCPKGGVSVRCANASRLSQADSVFLDGRTHVAEQKEHGGRLVLEFCDNARAASAANVLRVLKAVQLVNTAVPEQDEQAQSTLQGGAAISRRRSERLAMRRLSWKGASSSARDSLKCVLRVPERSAGERPVVQEVTVPVLL